MTDTTPMKSFVHNFTGDSCSESLGYPEDVKIDKEEDDEEKHSEQSDPEAFDVDNNIPVCGVCEGTPCQWDDFGDNLLEQANEMFEQTASVGDDGSTVIVLVNKSTGEIVNNASEYQLYSMFTYLKYGHLGRGNRICLPECVEDKI
jgi:hypothetical protein